jgi:glycosyltransferase involved in cell wall biosynthesis
MPQILFDCEKMKYANTGIFEVCKQLGHALIRNKAADEKLIYYIPASLKGFFGEEQQYVTTSKLHRLWMPSFGADVWHTTFQSTHYRPANPAIRNVLTIHDLNSIHEQLPQKKIDSYLKKIQRNIDRADHVVTISHFVMEDVKKHLDLRNKTASVVLNGCDLASYPGFDKPAYRPQRPFIFSIGSVNAKKNFHVLPALLHGNDFELIIAGPTFDDEYKKKILEEAALYQVTDRVKLVGSISGEDKYWYYNHCTAFLFPSLAEGFGLPIVEAMSAGKPCFISDRTSLPEVGGALCYYFHNFEPVYMQTIFNDGLLHYQSHDLTDAIKKHAATLSSDNAAKNYLQVYRSLY